MSRSVVVPVHVATSVSLCAALSVALMFLVVFKNLPSQQQKVLSQLGHPSVRPGNRSEVSQIISESGQQPAKLTSDSAEAIRASPPNWALRDERFNGTMNPEHVFLWYTKGEKTSSTVAATMIGRAYEKAGLAVVNKRHAVLEAAPGAYASVSHAHYSDEMLTDLRTAVQKPVLLVVSLRDAEDWLTSQAFRAERLNKGKNITGCQQLDWRNSTCKNYKKYLPVDTDRWKPWWILNHETIVEDTCAMLHHLNLECSLENAIGQRSRKDADASLSDCPRPDLSKEIECINKVNKALKSGAPVH